MFLLAVLLSCLGALVSSAPQKVFYDIDLAHTYFEGFVKTHNKEYKNEAERKTRFEIFKDNLKDINAKNSNQSNAVFGITQFTDMSSEEFMQLFTGCFKLGGETQCMRMMFNGTLGTAPNSLDWRTKNAVSSVKNQGRCGSCWAFSTVGTVEGQYAIKTGQIVDLSPQQLVDCTTTAQGCKGGWMSSAIMEVQRTFGGLLQERDYPYRGVQRRCNADRNRIATRITGCRQFMFNSESEIKETLAQVGPITVALSVNENVQHYVGGIFDASQCGSSVNHALLLVGYGSEGGIPYWLIKNSWGASWGEQGYFRISMNRNTCNIMGGQFVTVVVG